MEEQTDNPENNTAAVPAEPGPSTSAPAAAVEAEPQAAAVISEAVPMDEASETGHEEEPPPPAEGEAAAGGGEEENPFEEGLLDLFDSDESVMDEDHEAEVAAIEANRELPTNVSIRRHVDSPRLDPMMLIEPLLEDDDMEGGDEPLERRIVDEVNYMMDEDDFDSDDTASPDFIFEDESANRDVVRRWFLPAHRVHAAIRLLIAQSRRTEGGVAALLNRENFMQRMRRLIFTLDHNRQRGIRADAVLNNVERERNRQQQRDAERAQGMDASTAATEPEPENPVRFDTNLPAEHSYMGANMDRVSGVNYLDVGQRHHMILFMHQHMLFPGEVLPFMTSGPGLETEIDTQNGLLFGVCFPFNDVGNENIYGVTCQIYEKGTDARGHVLIKARALQRFIAKASEVTGPLQNIDSHPLAKCYGYVKILPEIYLPEPLQCIDMGSMNRFRDNASMATIYRHYQAATTPWPAHVYNEYSITAIVEKARTQLAQHKIDTMPTDPIQLSYWLVRNLHLSENMMKTIFKTDSVNIRMKLIASTFKEEGIFTCRYCGNRIANCRELFAMSKHGVQTQYCNSAGFIHETNTVYQVLRDAIIFSGEPSSEFSWFPGYKWQIIVCKICSRHIGWQFKAEEANMVPKSFFGLSSSCVRISKPMQMPPNPHAQIYRSFMNWARGESQ